MTGLFRAVTGSSAGLPVMRHNDDAPPTCSRSVDILRPGDVLAHGIRRFSNTPALQNSQIRAPVLRRPDLGTRKPGASGIARVSAARDLPTDIDDILGQIVRNPWPPDVQGADHRGPLA